ncbi:hypothetical protein GDO81_011179 [Engystomops pustulosus]|uniref:Uncharacterized protein n=1 Tax=Engystomops pustulosus TaxID=76066 RepID=A0AAV7BCI2_ENGPU|nr:hypothetical protein GDO81_011179 [Engystomops pustulosus]
MSTRCRCCTEVRRSSLEFTMLSWAQPQLFLLQVLFLAALHGRLQITPPCCNSLGSSQSEKVRILSMSRCVCVCEAR